MQSKCLRRTATRWMAVTPLCVAAAAAMAQVPSPATASSSATETASPQPTAGPELKLPELRDLGVAVPRPVRAATALLGLGRQRLALVLGIGTLGSRTVLDSTARDTQAVAQALREGGFVVMQREDLGGADLRAALKEFQERLQPGGVGFVYATAMGAQIDGQNVLLPRDLRLDASQSLAERHALIRAKAVPVAELVNALMGPEGSPRLLVLDAAWRHPALADLPAPGLSAQRLPPGVIALFGQALGVAQEVPAVAPLPQPAPTRATELAATPFARTLVGQLLAPRAKAPDALRATRRALVDGTLGTTEPWLGGDTEPEELTEASLLDGLVPRTPEDLAREAARQLARAATRPAAASAVTGSGTGAGLGAGASAGASGAGTGLGTAASVGASTAASAGEQSVAEVLEEAQRQRMAPRASASSTPQNPIQGDAMRPTAARGGADVASTTTPGGTPPPAPSALSQLGSVGSALGQVASVAGTAVSLASTAAGVAATAKLAQVSATAAVASTALGAAGSIAGQAVAMVARSGAASSAEMPVAAVLQAAGSGALTTAAAPALTAAAGSATTSAASTAATAATSASTASALAAPSTAGVVAAGGAVAPASPALAQAAAAAAAQAAGAPAAGAALSPAVQAAPARLAMANAAASTGAPPAAAPAGSAQGLAAAAADNQAVSAAGAGSPAASRAGAMAVSSVLALDGRTVRSAGGGERPAYIPKNNPFGYAEGDTYTYQVIDTWKDEITGRYTHAIEAVLEDGRLLANGEQVQLDAQGRLLMQVNGDGTITQFEPRQELWWSNPKRGEDRDLRFTETVRRTEARMDASGRRATGSAGSITLAEVEWKGSASVGRLRKLELPAGEFEVLPIESSGWHYTRRSDGVRVDTKWSRTVWYSPKLGHPVAIDAEDTDNLGRLLRRERVELVHAQAQRATP